MKPALLLACALATHASVIDTTTLFQSGTVEYRFNADGQAYTPEGVPVTGVTFGFDPYPPCDACVAPPPAGWSPPPPWTPLVDAPAPPIPETPPTSETPEPSRTGMAVLGAVMMVIGGRKR